MPKYSNSRKKKFVESLPENGLEDSDTAARSKFCLSFLDVNQDAGQSFEEWDHEGGVLSSLELLKKLKDFSREALKVWEERGPLIIYGEFPKKSDFTRPKFVPHDVRWGRFRLGNKVRLAGFVIPESLDGFEIKKGGQVYRLDTNTFYVVFLDKDHKFYKTEPP